eukprot:TRINITY_DN29594_c0_g1_i1.p1 TRINITY_DN29594_c0_g1~~TRINITY_DN29594_c0_g1_i1.p1  ORF type:complete len:295 (+),score=88.94 TRINITY_DN29594_c0_g1_i1:81-887(+)
MAPKATPLGEQLRSVFSAIDSGNQGHISYSDLRAAFQGCGIDFTYATVGELYTVAEGSESGLVTFSEWTRLAVRFPQVVSSLCSGLPQGGASAAESTADLPKDKDPSSNSDSDDRCELMDAQAEKLEQTAKDEGGLFSVTDWGPEAVGQPGKGSPPPQLHSQPLSSPLGEKGEGDDDEGVSKFKPHQSTAVWVSGQQPPAEQAGGGGAAPMGKFGKGDGLKSGGKVGRGKDVEGEITEGDHGKAKEKAAQSGIDTEAGRPLLSPRRDA